MKNSTQTKFHRFNKEKNAIQQFKSPTHISNALPSKMNGQAEKNENFDENPKLKQCVNQFIKGQLNSEDFQNALREQNVNPEIEEIHKHIKKAGSGSVGHKELMFNVMKHGTCKYSNDPTKIKPNTNTWNNFDHHQQEDLSRAYLVREGEKPLILKKRKNKDNDPNLHSKKEVFDWDLYNEKKRNLR